MQRPEYEILSVLAAEKNMRKAAERLFVSQPALSQRLQAIEKNWGTQIFIRSQKGLALTPAGEQIIDYVNETLKREEKLRDEITFFDSEVHGTLKLAVASIIGQYWLPKVLKTFVERYPHVKISLVTGWSSEILKQLYEENLHIGIIRGNPDWKGQKQHLFSDELFLVDTEIKSIEEVHLSKKPFIQFKSDSTYYQEIQTWWQNQFQIPPKRTIVVDQIETCKQMVIHGIGFAILPSITIAQEKNITKIPLFDDKGVKISRETWLLSYESAHRLKQVDAFLQLVNELK
ncbi:LysR family transcriptional regulator [Lottiidibacillus patelloidae]|uniref:LysR family transcriptional regulator n=1 Tax=Lottiidibacillus patelloidae TaxID=2670334 RepID=A0A263BXB4_9BACI|nr:LysR family transcriptional regulator [Lottiidibacillus patelloidae]OZM58401.1 LysR family transcriptional regulator [Lottiidibacillus patelloidae]